MNYPDFHTHNGTGNLPCSIVCLSYGADAASFRPLAGAHYSAGWHPWRLQPDYAQHIEALERLLRHPQVVALGECGLDRLRGLEMSLQEDAFSLQAVLADKLSMPVIVHCVRAFDVLLRLHKALRPSSQWTIHGFRGRPQLACQLLSAGMNLSFGFKFNAESVRLCPIDRLFIETDEGDSALLPQLYERIAAIKGVEAGTLAGSISARFPFRLS